ncbi:MAG: hypothetical protein M3371_10515 [Acidobacteriota bacterium]|nr:hypothetical protein [Acidobacteriota bacterium]
MRRIVLPAQASVHRFDLDHRSLQFPQTLFRREFQSPDQQSQINAEVARARGGAAGLGIKQLLLDASIHSHAAGIF